MRFIWECKYCHKIFSCNYKPTECSTISQRRRYCFCESCFGVPCKYRIEEVIDRKLIIFYKAFGIQEYEENIKEKNTK